jgi:hypothetical protein
MRSVELVVPLSRADCVHLLRGRTGEKAGSGAIVGRFGDTSARLRAWGKTNESQVKNPKRHKKAGKESGNYDSMAA